MQAAQISLSALDVEWRRLEVISENLANVNSARTRGGAMYRARHLLSGPGADFSTYLNGSSTIDLDKLRGVAVTGIVDDNAQPRLVHEPGNPLADEHGMVAYPAIDHAEQMLLMVKTSRVYEANIVALNAAHQMYAKALDLGKHSS